MLTNIFLFFFLKCTSDRFYDNGKGFYLMKLLIWEDFDGCSYFLDPLRKGIQNIELGSMGRFRPGMTSLMLLRINIIYHKTWVIILVAVVCLKHFSKFFIVMFRTLANHHLSKLKCPTKVLDLCCWHFSGKQINLKYITYLIKIY